MPPGGKESPLNFKAIDWRSLQKYVSPQASQDLNTFLEKLPQTAGNTVLVAAGIAWAAAAAIGLFTTVQMQTLTEMKAKLKETQALQPVVPVIKDVPVDPKLIETFAKEMALLYPGLVIKSQGPSITITANTTSSFAQFREAVGHVQNGGQGWRVSVEKLCVGRECDKDKLSVLLKINKVSVDKPQ